MSKETSIFLVPKPLQQPRARLFCFPYAGGSAGLFLPWVQSVPDDIELVLVQLPGRGARIMESPHTTMDSIIEELLENSDFICSVPFYLFGHSLGSRVAYELSRQLQASGKRLPERLFVSGSRAPHLAVEKKQIHDLPKEEFLAELADMAGTPEEVLNNAELMEFCMPFLRADFKIAERYKAQQDVLDCSVQVLSGKDDSHFTRVELEAWAELTNHFVAIEEFDGGHFYIHDQMDDVLSVVLSAFD